MPPFDTQHGQPLCSSSQDTENAIPISNPRVAVEVTEHVKWARMIAHGVRQAFQFRAGSQEEQDLEATAYLAIVELAIRFDSSRIPAGGDPLGAFRGWAAIEVRCRCRTKARRLRNGGTYRTRREKGRKTLMVERLKGGSDIIDPHSLIEEDENEDGLDLQSRHEG